MHGDRAPALPRPLPLASTLLLTAAVAAATTGPAAAQPTPAAIAADGGSAASTPPASGSTASSGPSATIAAPADPVATQIQNAFVLKLSDDKITVSVLPLPGQQYAVTLSGQLADQKAVDDATQKAQAVKASLSDVLKPATISELRTSNLKVAPKDTSKDADKKAQYLQNRFRLLSGLESDSVVITVLPVAEGKYGVVISGRILSNDPSKLARIINTAGAVQDPSLDVVNVAQLRTSTNVELQADRKDKDIALLTDLANGRVADPRVTVKVMPTTPDRFVIVLSGKLDNDLQVESVLARANRLMNDRQDQTPGIEDIESSQLTAAEPQTTEMWPLSSLGDLGSADGGTTNTINALVDALNQVYGGVGGAPQKVVTRDNNNLWITGPEHVVFEIKGFLALADTSFPQVQMDVWAIQVSGERRHVAAEVTRISADISGTQALMQKANLQLAEILDQNKDQFCAEKDALFKQLYDAKFDRQPGRPLSTTEALIFLSLAQNRKELLTQWQAKVRDDLPAGTKAFPRLEALMDTGLVTSDRNGVGAFLSRVAAFKNYTTVLRQYDQIRRAKQLAAATKLASPVPTGGGGTASARGTSVASLGGAGAVPPGATAALAAPAPAIAAATAAPPYRKHESIAAEGAPGGDSVDNLTSKSLDRAAPEELAESGAAVDRMLKNVLEAYAADMQDMYLQPLLQRTQVGAASSAGTTGSSGTSLVGRTRIVVTSRNQAALQPDIVSYTDTTRPAPLDPTAILNAMFPAGARGRDASSTTAVDASGTSTTTSTTTTTNKNTDLSGLPRLLSTMPPGQAALVAAALTGGDVQPAFTKVAPGIGLNVRPSVSPDGSAADLVLDATFGLETEAIGTGSRTDVWATAPPDAVKSHHVTTTATVDGFELFDVSSFQIQTSSPRGPGYIPVLGRLPLIGQAFQWPQGSKVTDHESIILVNATLVPRSLGLLGFFGANKTGGFLSDQ